MYIMTNRANGTLYLGVTNDLARRAWEHREGVGEGFTRRYGLKRLAWYKPHDDWPRAWKVRLILSMNPEWLDLYEGLAG